MRSAADIRKKKNHQQLKGGKARGRRGRKCNGRGEYDREVDWKER